MSDDTSRQETNRKPGTWPKGVSGNPGGRPRGIEALAREHTPEAIAALVRALKRPAHAVPAAVALLDRGWGKPTQAVTGADGKALFPQLVVMFGKDGDVPLGVTFDDDKTIDAITDC
jgi:hypothetical protein